MSISGLMVGVVATLGLVLAVICYSYFSWLNWLNVIFAMFGFLLSVIGTIKGTNRILGIVGIGLCGSIAIVSAFNLT
ncbi:MAG: hypothetical protein WC877_06395 [Dehalococcoidales bacterium]|jgi:CHASE2 domain-containing sensor protein